MTRALLPVLLLTLPWAPPAAAGEEADKTLAVVQRYVDLGEELFRAGQYADAVESFAKAEGILVEAEVDVPPPLYRQMARCYDQLGQTVSALSHYKRFQALVDAEDKRVSRALKEARDAVTRLQGVLDRTALEFKVEPDGAEVRVDNRVVGRTPLDPLKVSPGPHQVTLWAEGLEPMSLEMNVAAGATVPVVAKLVPARPAASGPGAEASPPASEDTLVDRELEGIRQGEGGGSGWRSWAAGGLGVAGVGLGVGAVLLALSAADLRAEADGIASDGKTGDERTAAQARVNELYEEAAPKDTAALALGVLAAGAIGGGVYLLLAGPEEGTETGVGPFTSGVVDAQVGLFLAPPGARLSVRF